MNKRVPTAERILEASRRLFNKKGFAATKLTEIADDVGISQGNLSYHFPTKKDLVERLRDEARRRAQERRAALTPGLVADDYVEHLLFGMTLLWENRFIFRDRSQYADASKGWQADPEMAADFEELFALITRIEEEGMFRHDLKVDLQTLTRSLWIVSRYWMDYLHEHEWRDEITWVDQERGIQHHFAVLLPCLTAPARRAFNTALERASRQTDSHLNDL